jgi:hypothetical protein
MNNTVKFVDKNNNTHYIPKVFLFYPNGFKEHNLYLVEELPICRTITKKERNTFKDIRKQIIVFITTC